MMNELLFSEEELIPWLREWQNMPEYDIRDLDPQFQIIVNFGCAADLADFAQTIGQPITPGPGRQLQSLWFPPAEIGRYSNKRYIDLGGRDR